MLYRYVMNLLRPARQAQAQVRGVKAKKAQFFGDIKRVKGMGQHAKAHAAGAKQSVSKGRDKFKAARGKIPGVGGGSAGAAGQGPGAGGLQQPAGGSVSGQPGFGAPGQAPGMPGGQMPGGQMPGGQMPGGMPGGMRGRIKRCGFLWLKKKCVECQNRMEKGWDSCPYCNAAAPAPAPAPAAPAGSAKTQAFMLDDAGTGNSNMALLGWLVPVRGPQRGELFTLASESLIGTEPACTVVLQDNFMSSRHCEIKAEGGQWILKDLGSTNGTFVNDKRVDRHELVDSDFVKVGQCLLKFKCI